MIFFPPFLLVVILFVLMLKVWSCWQISGQDKLSANMASTSIFSSNSPLKSRFHPAPFSSMEDLHHAARVSGRFATNPVRYEQGNLHIIECFPSFSAFPLIVDDWSNVLLFLFSLFSLFFHPPLFFFVYCLTIFFKWYFSLHPELLPPGVGQDSEPFRSRHDSYNQDYSRRVFGAALDSISRPRSGRYWKSTQIAYPCGGFCTLFTNFSRNCLDELSTWDEIRVSNWSAKFWATADDAMLS